MSDYKDRMIEAYERGWCGYYDAYDYVREQYADAADLARKAEKENPPDERIVAVREDGSYRTEPDEEPPNWREKGGKP